MKRIFLLWGREVQLSKYLAEGLGADIYPVYIKYLGNFRLPTFIRYLWQGVVSFYILVKNRPQAVIVQNPPIFASLVALIYCRLFGAKLAIDSHTAAFLDKKWIFFYPLFRFVARRANFNSCHNYKNLEILKSWSVEPSMVMQFFNPKYDENILNQPMKETKLEEAAKKENIKALVVNRFADDDDWQTVVKVAREMSEITFFITGDQRQTKEQELIKSVPKNVCFTGYLKHEEFIKLMQKCKIVLAFTLRPDTVLWSIRECLALNKPFVTTDSDVLRHYFNKVGIFTKSDPNELKQRINEAISRESEIKANIKEFLIKDQERWENEISQIKKAL